MDGRRAACILRVRPLRRDHLKTGGPEQSASHGEKQDTDRGSHDLPHDRLSFVSNDADCWKAQEAGSSFSISRFSFSWVSEYSRKLLTDSTIWSDRSKMVATCSP